MPTILTQLSTEPLTAERTWTVEDIPVLTASISLPAPAEGTGGGAARRIRRYYQLQSRSFLRYCERWLLPMAEAEYRAALAASAPLPLLRAELSYQVTYNENGLWSLYTQSREVTLPGQARVAAPSRAARRKITLPDSQRGNARSRRQSRAQMPLCRHRAAEASRMRQRKLV